MPTLSEEKFKIFWMKLSERQRINRVEHCYKIFRRVADKQITFLRRIKKEEENLTKGARCLYFFVIVESFWEDADFAIWLRKSRYRFYAEYPARTMMEKLLKILWFTKKNPNEQDRITRKELLKSCLDYYRMEIKSGRSGQNFENHYINLNTNMEFSDIKTVKRKDLEAFPPYEQLCYQSGLTDASQLYDSYRFLSSLPHGDLLSVFMLQDQRKETYRRAMMLVVRFCIEMIKVTDFHLGGTTKDDVMVAIAEADKERKRQPSLTEKMVNFISNILFKRVKNN